MNTKKEYVSPQVTRVKLEPTQAVLSQCEVGAVGISNAFPAGTCDVSHDCKQRHSGGNSAAAS
jgi:hypothetical protein